MVPEPYGWGRAFYIDFIGLPTNTKLSTSYPPLMPSDAFHYRQKPNLASCNRGPYPDFMHGDFEMVDVCRSMQQKFLTVIGFSKICIQNRGNQVFLNLSNKSEFSLLGPI